MTPEDHYEAWKRRKDVPEDFAQRVMRAVRDHHRRRTWNLAARAWLGALLSSRAARLGLCSLAVLVGLFRVLQVLSLFLAPSFGL
jgi:hypothetical protein